MHARPHTCRLVLLVPLVAAACDPYGRWPDEGDAFPYAYTPETDLEPYEEVRFETETWHPSEDYTEAGLYLLKASYHRPSAPVEELEHYATMREQLPPLGDGIRLSFVGDVMWVGGNWDGFLTPSAGMLDGDVRIGNLETPTSPSDPTTLAELEPWAFNAPPEILDGLPLDLLQLNNNHSLDVEDAGLEATVAEVAARGFEATGVDRHATIDVSGETIAFLSYTWGVNRRELVTTHELYIVPFGHIGEPIDLSGIEADIDEARATADSVVVLVHWGFEYEYYPDPHFMVLGREIVAAGADLVVGSGPHVVQPPEICHVNRPERVPGIGTCSVKTADGIPRTAAILYSLGNFGTSMATAPCQTGIVATVSLDDGVTGLGWEAAAVVDGESGIEVRPLASATDAPELTAEAARLEAHLGTGWKR